MQNLVLFAQREAKLRGGGWGDRPRSERFFSNHSIHRVKTCMGGMHANIIISPCILFKVSHFCYHDPLSVCVGRQASHETMKQGNETNRTYLMPQ